MNIIGLFQSRGPTTNVSHHFQSRPLGQRNEPGSWRKGRSTGEGSGGWAETDRQTASTRGEQHSTLLWALSAGVCEAAANR